MSDWQCDPVRPYSSLPSMGDIQRAFQQAIDRGATQLIVLTVSSAMSGTYGLVQNAASLLNLPVSMVNSRGPTMSLGWQVLEAPRARDFGADLTTILDRVSKVRERLAQFVAMDSLEYLQRGGRIGGAVNGWDVPEHQTASLDQSQDRSGGASLNCQNA